LDSWD